MVSVTPRPVSAISLSICGRYVDTTVAVNIDVDPATGAYTRKLVPTRRDDPRRQALEALVKANGIVPSDIGWFSKKMESASGCRSVCRRESDGIREAVLDYGGYLARQEGLYAFHAYARR